MKRMGALIKAERERAGLRGYDLAHRLGKQPSYVTRLETGATKTLPPPEELAAIAGVLGLSSADLLAAAGYDVRDPTAPANLRDAERQLLRAVADLTEREIGFLLNMAPEVKRIRRITDSANGEPAQTPPPPSDEQSL